MTEYLVTAERGRRRWVLQSVAFPGAISEVSRLSQAKEAMREAIGFVAEVEPETVEVTLDIRLPDEVAAHLEQADQARAEAERANAQAAAERRAAARALHDDGLSVREVGQVLEVSHQRAQQLISA